METCENCGTTIGKLETPWLHGEYVVCKECWKRLNDSRDDAEPQSANRTKIATRDRRRVPHAITITVSTAALIGCLAVGFFVWQGGVFAPRTIVPENLAPRTTVPEIFKTQLMRFLEEGTKTNALTGQGVTYLQLHHQVVRTKASYDLVRATWPPTLAVGCHEKFERAFRGWDLTLELWKLKNAERYFEPTEPDVDGFAHYVTYGRDALVVRTRSETFGYQQYRGKKYLPFDENISVLMTLAGRSFHEGQAEILQALQ